MPYYNPTIVYGSWWHPRPPWVWVPPPYYRPPNMGDVIAAGIFWGLAVAITNSIWNDYRPDWRTQQIHVHHHIHFHPSRPRPQPRPGAVWSHDPLHRKGVAYRDPALRDKFAGVARPAPRPSGPDTRPGRGDDPNLQPRPAVLPSARPAPEPRPNVTRPAPRPETTRPTLPPETARPAPRPSIPRPEPQRPATRPAPRPSPLQPGTSREQVQAHAERGRQSRQATPPMSRPTTAKPAPTRPAPATPPRLPAAAPTR